MTLWRLFDSLPLSPFLAWVSVLFIRQSNQSSCCHLIIITVDWIQVLLSSCLVIIVSSQVDCRLKWYNFIIIFQSEFVIIICITMITDGCLITSHITFSSFVMIIVLQNRNPLWKKRIWYPSQIFPHQTAHWKNHISSMCNDYPHP